MCGWVGGGGGWRVWEGHARTFFDFVISLYIVEKVEEFATLEIRFCDIKQIDFVMSKSGEKKYMASNRFKPNL